MLLMLLLTVAVANIALGFYTTQVFRRDRVLALAQAANSYVQPRGESVAENEVEDPVAGELPSEPAAVESESTDDEAELPPVEPAQQPPLEALFYLAARLVENLAQIDHSVLACDVQQQATDERLADMWPAVAEKAAPIEHVLQEIAATEAGQSSEHSLASMHEAGLAVVEHCRSLTHEMATAEKREANSVSGMHHLRDLFSKACEFRNLCEDRLVEELAVDHRLVAAGRVALQQKLEQVISAQSATEYGVMSLEVEQVGELNSMHGAAVVNVLLDELAELFAEQLPDQELICRYHGQKYVVLLSGDGESIASLADQLQQQIGQTVFRFEQQTLDVSLGVVVVPLAVAGPDLIAQFAKAKAGAKEQDFQGVVVDCGEHLEVNVATSHELTPAEVILQV